MIRHIVLLNFTDTTSDAIKAGLMADLAGLRDQLDGIIDFHSGPNVSPETELVRGFDHGFWFDFATEADRDAYLVHPRHQAIGARIVAHTTDGTDGVFVLDMNA